jgi:hypothetical protein
MIHQLVCGQDMSMSMTGDGALGTSGAAPGTNSLGTALPSGIGGHVMKGPLLGTDPTIDNDSLERSRSARSRRTHPAIARQIDLALPAQPGYPDVIQALGHCRTSIAQRRADTWDCGGSKTAAPMLLRSKRPLWNINGACFLPPTTIGLPDRRCPTRPEPRRRCRAGTLHRM